MEKKENGEVICPTCCCKTLVIRQPIYEGLSKTGEELKCTECGTVFSEDEEVEFVAAEKPDIFKDDQLPENPDVFKGDEVTLCRHCRHYLENPFTQRCMLHHKEVQATDTCENFTSKEK